MAKFYVVCDDDCRYEGMTKEQILTAIEQALENGYVSDPDGAVFSKIKEIRANIATRLWVGTESQYNAISPAPATSLSLVRVGADGVLYLCKDDSTLEKIMTFAVDDEVTDTGRNAVSGAAVAGYVSGRIDSTVKSGSTNAVSGKAVTDYVTAQLAAIVNYEGVAF